MSALEEWLASPEGLSWREAAGTLAPSIFGFPDGTIRPLATALHRGE
jgi:hypothetical protein